MQEWRLWPADATALPFADASFSVVASMGLFHHLDNFQAKQAIAEMARVAGPSGSVAIFDAVRPVSALRRPLAALIRGLDFGRYMRDEAGLRALFGDQDGWRFERMPGRCSTAERLSSTPGFIRGRRPAMR